MAKRRNPNRPLTNRQRRARRRNLITGLVVAVVVIAVAGVAYALLSEDKPGVEFDDMGNRHLASEPTAYIWNSVPPTSGPHSAQIANWGIHTEPVPEWNQVHNLEDGGVIMHYNCPDGCEDIVAELEDIVNEKGTNQLILEPYPDMDSTIAVTAWTRLLTLDEMDRDAIVEFIDAYRGIDHHR
jgi:hypothetical protein